MEKAISAEPRARRPCALSRNFAASGVRPRAAVFYTPRSKLEVDRPSSFERPVVLAMSNKEALLTREKEGAGSVGASAVTLAKICVGCGVMALPWGFMRGGVLSLPGAWHYRVCAYRVCAACSMCERANSVHSSHIQCASSVRAVRRHMLAHPHRLFPTTPHTT